MFPQNNLARKGLRYDMCESLHPALLRGCNHLSIPNPDAGLPNLLV